MIAGLSLWMRSRQKAFELRRAMIVREPAAAWCPPCASRGPWNVGSCCCRTILLLAPQLPDRLQA